MVISCRRFAENRKEVYRNKKKAREGRAKLLFLFIKYVNFVALSPPSRRRSLNSLIVSLRNHDDNGNKNVINLQI